MATCCHMKIENASLFFVIKSDVKFFFGSYLTFLNKMQCISRGIKDVKPHSMFLLKVRVISLIIYVTKSLKIIKCDALVDKKSFVYTFQHIPISLSTIFFSSFNRKTIR